MKVSIIIPVYNAERYLKKCLDSVVGQTESDIELIIVNDGSKDGSASICKQYLTDSRVKYYYQENAGPAVAMNFGLSVAIGEYVWFVDADDWIEEDAVERLINETSDMVIFNFYRGYAQKHNEPIPDGIYDYEGIQNVIYPYLLSYIDSAGDVNYIFHNTWMRLYKRVFLKENNISFVPSVRNGLDLLFTFEATVKAKNISVKFNDYLYHYMPADKSMTSSYVEKYWERRKEIIKNMYELIPSNILYDQMPLRIFSWAVTGIENELKYTQGRKENIRAIVTDPICDTFKWKLDISRLNETNQKYYEQICNEDVNGIWLTYKKRKIKSKYRNMIKKFKRFVKKIFHI